ncbi:copper resistance CopC/CopD family protein [Methylobrevis albus]|uniref:CopD family protein n=1 Tax=Methylobrevis albus TaxID=2793297 RepID=A0A931HZB1_9HYPH|nr:copper resistance protein CopC [Methylobrevis albus]MBH0236386.1 CopD family protein [Methylobrevis albus]
MRMANSMRRIAMMLRVLVLAVLAGAGLSGEAAAHAALTGTDPVDGAVLAAPPPRLALTFSEPVSPIALRLIGPDGAATALDRYSLRDRTLEIAAPDGLADGTHVLSWRVISEDGHPVGGALVFSIGAPSAAAPIVADAGDPAARAGLWAARVALYVGLFVGVGGVFGRLWLGGDAGPGRAALLGVLGLGAAGTVLSAGLQGLDTLGAGLAALASPAVWSAGLGTSFGRTVVLALAALALAAVALIRGAGRLALGLGATAALLAAGSLGASGHASAASPGWLMRSMVVVHAAGILVWIGALPPLAATLRAGPATARPALARFSAVIPVVVAAIVGAGTVLAVVQVEAPAALTATDYGRVFLVKLALLAPLFALAGWNRWRLTRPALAGRTAETRRLRRIVVAEILLAAAILGVAATWRFTPPPRALAIADAAPAAIHIHTARAMVDLSLTPGRAGRVDVAAGLMTGDFGPLDAKEVTFVFALPAAGIEPIRRRAAKGADALWRAADVTLPLGGAWTVRVDILISDFEIVRVTGEIPLRN